MGHQGCCTEGKRMNMYQASIFRQAPGESLLTSLTSCGALGKSWSFSVPQFPCLEAGPSVCTYFLKL